MEVSNVTIRMMIYFLNKVFEYKTTSPPSHNHFCACVYLHGAILAGGDLFGPCDRLLGKM